MEFHPYIIQSYASGLNTDKNREDERVVAGASSKELNLSTELSYIEARSTLSTELTPGRS